jgi:hypothetical protein
MDNFQEMSLQKQITFRSDDYDGRFVLHQLGGVIVRVLVHSSRFKRVWVFAAPLLSTHQYGVRAKAGSLGIKIICLSIATCLHAHCFIVCLLYI